jgi:hypothetical protein
VSYPIVVFYEDQPIPAGVVRFWPNPNIGTFQRVTTTHMGNEIALIGSGPFDVGDDRIAALIRDVFVPNFVIEAGSGTGTPGDPGGGGEPATNTVGSAVVGTSTVG